MTAITIFDACFDDLARRGFKIALWRSMAIAVKVKIETFTDRICTNGQKGHRNLGRSQR